MNLVLKLPPNNNKTIASVKEVPLPSSSNLSSFDSNRTRKERILQTCDMHSYFNFCISLKIFCKLEICRLTMTQDFVEMDWGAPHLSLASNSQSFCTSLSSPGITDIHPHVWVHSQASVVSSTCLGPCLKQGVQFTTGRPQEHRGMSPC